MFSALEDELVRVLRANLSPRHVASDRITAGPATSAGAADPPQVIVTAGQVRLNPDEAAAPPRGARAAVEDVFPPDGTAPLRLSRPPLEPLRVVELDAIGGGRPAALHERDDFTVDYVNGKVRLREPAASAVRIRYATFEPFRTTTATRLRVEYRVEISGTTSPGDAQVDTIAAVSLGALAANAASIDGLSSDGLDLPEAGAPGLARQVSFVFEAPVFVAGSQPDAGRWRLDYAVDAWMLLLPIDGRVGRMRQIAGGIAWDDRRVEMLLSSPSAILARETTILQGVGPATAEQLAARGLTTVALVADASQIGPATVDSAIERARTVRTGARAVVSGLVRARPRLADPNAFLEVRLSDLAAGDLTSVGVGAAEAAAIIAAVATVVAATTASELALGDLLPPA